MVYNFLFRNNHGGQFYVAEAKGIFGFDNNLSYTNYDIHYRSFRNLYIYIYI